MSSVLQTAATSTQLQQAQQIPESFMACLIVEKRSQDQTADANQKYQFNIQYNHFNVVVTCRATSSCEVRERLCSCMVTARPYRMECVLQQAGTIGLGRSGIVLFSSFQVIDNFLVIRSRICPVPRLRISADSQEFMKTPAVSTIKPFQYFFLDKQQ